MSQLVVRVLPPKEKSFSLMLPRPSPSKRNSKLIVPVPKLPLLVKLRPPVLPLPQLLIPPLHLLKGGLPAVLPRPNDSLLANLHPLPLLPALCPKIPIPSLAITASMWITMRFPRILMMMQLLIMTFVTLTQIAITLMPMLPLMYPVLVVLVLVMYLLRSLQSLLPLSMPTTSKSPSQVLPPRNAVLIRVLQTT